MSEALAAGLCASFILADGFTKSVGAWLLQNGVSERWMPAAAGLRFVPLLLGYVWYDLAGRSCWWGRSTPPVLFRSPWKTLSAIA